jgi:hypothetical protein
MHPAPTPVTPPPVASATRRVRVWAVPVVVVVDLAVAWVGGFAALSLLVATGSFGIGPWPATVVGTVGAYAVGVVLLRTAGRVAAAAGTVCCTVAVCVGVPMIGVTAESTPASLLLAVVAVGAACAAVAVRRSAGTVGLAVASVVGAFVVAVVAVSG